MLIAQITDVHIGRDDRFAGNEARLQAVVARVLDAEPDIVLATGDLTEDGDAASYDRLKALLAPFGSRILPVLGNHDERSGFLAAFPDTGSDDGFVQYVRRWGDRRLIVLDTVDAGRHDGAFCEGRARWLGDELDRLREIPTLIALHHPPVLSGIDWMDAGVDGGWTQRLARTLRGREHVVGLVAGHLHRPMATRFAGHPLIVASSVAPQVVLDLADEDRAGPATDRPRIVEESPGFALHRWTASGLISHFGSARANRIVAHLDAASGRIIPSGISG